MDGHITVFGNKISQGAIELQVYFFLKINFGQLIVLAVNVSYITYTYNRRLCNNQLSGNIPSDLKSLTNLQYLFVYLFDH